MRKAMALLLALALTCALALGALAAEGDDLPWAPFTDVPEGAWYEDELFLCRVTGLVDGVGDGRFAPEKSVTLAETVAMACRLHSQWTAYREDREAMVFTQGTPWYGVYADYALREGIIAADRFENMDAEATRRQFATVMARALPAETYTVMNTVEDGAIPDLAAGSEAYDDIYTLARAGILTGDPKGTFRPDSAITRAEAVAVLARLAAPEYRVHLTLTGQGLFDFDLRGLAFRAPGGFELTERTGMYAALESVDDEGFAVISASTKRAEGPAADNAERIAQMELELREGLTALGVGQALTFEALTVADYPAVQTSYSWTSGLQEEEAGFYGAFTSYVTWIWNTDSDRIVSVSLIEPQAPGSDYTPRYRAMLEGTVRVPDLSGGGIRPAFKEAVDRLMAFAQEFQAYNRELEAAFARADPELYAQYTALTDRYQDLQDRMGAGDSQDFDALYQEYIDLLTEQYTLQIRVQESIQANLPDLYAEGQDLEARLMSMEESLMSALDVTSTADELDYILDILNSLTDLDASALEALHSLLYGALPWSDLSY